MYHDRSGHKSEPYLQNADRAETVPEKETSCNSAPFKFGSQETLIEILEPSTHFAFE